MGDLSENLDDWPASPYTLLGVTRQSSKSEVRRAWFRLIRRFKPDKFPAHFQRLHAAYEQLLHFAPDDSDGAEQGLAQAPPATPDSNDSERVHGDADHDGPSAGPLIWSPAMPANNGDRAFVGRPGEEVAGPEVWRQNHDDDVDRQRSRQKSQALAELQERVAAGQLEQATEHLLQIGDGSVTSDQKQFWAFLIDSMRAPAVRQSPLQRIECLLRLMACPDLMESALPWLERELLAEPSLAKHPLWNQVVKQGLPTKAVVAVLHCRWQFLSWQDYSDVLGDGALIERLAGLEGYLWKKTLIRMLDFVVWHSATRCREAIKRIEHDLACEDRVDHSQLYRLDIRVHQGLNWQATYGKIFRSSCHAIPELAPDACAVHPLLFARIARSFFANALTKYRLFLDRNATHVVENCSYLYDAVLYRMLSLELPIAATCTADLANCERIVAAFFQRHRRPVYRKIRLSLLRFCLTYQLSLIEFGQIADRLAADNRNNQGSWSMIIQADLVLRTMEVMFHRFSRDMPG